MKRLMIFGIAWLAVGCEGPQDAVRVPRALVVHSAGLAPARSSSGWTVQLSEARAVISDLRFTRGGETHAAARPLRWLVGQAWAHPGHGAGGEVVGSLGGRFVVDLMADGALIGEATVLEGAVDGLAFTFEAGSAADGLAAGDPLLGHGLVLVGEAAREGVRVPFTARLAFEPGTRVEGIPLQARISAGASGPALGLGLTLQDPFEPDTLFDGVDFGPGDPRALEGIEDPSTNRLRRNARSHDHWLGAVREAVTSAITEREE